MDLAGLVQPFRPGQPDGDGTGWFHHLDHQAVTVDGREAGRGGPPTAVQTSNHQQQVVAEPLGHLGHQGVLVGHQWVGLGGGQIGGSEPLITPLVVDPANPEGHQAEPGVVDGLHGPGQVGMHRHQRRLDGQLLQPGYRGEITLEQEPVPDRDRGPSIPVGPLDQHREVGHHRDRGARTVIHDRDGGQEGTAIVIDGGHDGPRRGGQAGAGLFGQ